MATIWQLPFGYTLKNLINQSLRSYLFCIELVTLSEAYTTLCNIFRHMTKF